MLNRRPVTSDVVISSGHKNFHMLFSAAEMARRGRLAQLICGAYPRAWELAVLAMPPLSWMTKLQRFARRREVVPDQLIRQSRLSETIDSVALVLEQLTRGRLHGLHRIAFRAYGRAAARHLTNARSEGARIYHFRAGFGQSSIKRARELGMVTICDHSIAHPSLLDALIADRGRFPVIRPPLPDGLWRSVLDDIEAADVVLVNSDFVRESFVYMGHDPARIVVIPQGVEDKFVECLPSQLPVRSSTGPMRLLFAGGINQRKGIDYLASAMAEMKNFQFELHLAGPLDAAGRSRYEGLLSDPRVHYHGQLSQTALATLMADSDVFVFPSLAEGAARVLFEAMAAGCAVICTPNSGSVTLDGITGLIIPPGDSQALCEALSVLLGDPNLAKRMGSEGRRLISEGYRQIHYGDALERLYAEWGNSECQSG